MYTGKQMYSQLNLPHGTKNEKNKAVAEMVDRLATTYMGRKVGGGCCAPFRGGAGSPSNTMSPGPQPTSVPSGTLIHLTVWTQYTNRKDRTMVP